MSRRGALLFAAMCVIWGIPYLLIRVAVRDFSPTDVVCLRTTIGVVLLLPFLVRSVDWRAIGQKWRLVAAYTVVELTIPWWLLSTAEQHLTSSLSSLLVASVPFLGILVNRASGGDEVIDRRRAAGLVVGFSGVIVIVGLQVGSVSAVAIIAVLITALGYATGPIILSRKLSDLPDVPVVAVSLAITSVVYAPFAVFTWPAHTTAHAWEAVIVLGGVCTALGFVVAFALFREVGPTRAVVVTYVNPAVAVTLGVAILGEPLTTGIVIGFPLVIVGSVLATWRRTPMVDARVCVKTR